MIPKCPCLGPVMYSTYRSQYQSLHKYTCRLYLRLLCIEQYSSFKQVKHIFYRWRIYHIQLLACEKGNWGSYNLFLLIFTFRITFAINNHFVCKSFRNSSAEFVSAFHVQPCVLGYVHVTLFPLFIVKHVDYYVQ